MSLTAVISDIYLCPCITSEYSLTESARVTAGFIRPIPGDEVEHITRTVLSGPGEGARFSLSKESFLTLKAGISKVEDCQQLSTPFHSKVSR